MDLFMPPIVQAAAKTGKQRKIAAQAVSCLFFASGGAGKRPAVFE
jgi:hypothetical protein